MPATYDDTASIGKLYRRQDEIGTPFCVTVDVETLDDGAATIRERDSMTQERVALELIPRRLADLLAGVGVGGRPRGRLGDMTDAGHAGDRREALERAESRRGPAPDRCAARRAAGRRCRARVPRPRAARARPAGRGGAPRAGRRAAGPRRDPLPGAAGPGALQPWRPPRCRRGVRPPGAQRSAAAAWTLAEAEERLGAAQPAMGVEAARRAVRLEPRTARRSSRWSQALARTGDARGAFQAAAPRRELLRRLTARRARRWPTPTG